MNHALTQAAIRLEILLEKETAALRSGSLAGISDITEQKNRSLLEFSRLSRGIDHCVLPPAMKTSLSRLNRLLEENRRLLGLHVRASNEIASLVSRSIAADESDGTYGAQLGRRPPQRGGDAR